MPCLAYGIVNIFIHLPISMLTYWFIVLMQNNNVTVSFCKPENDIYLQGHPYSEPLK